MTSVEMTRYEAAAVDCVNSDFCDVWLCDEDGGKEREVIIIINIRLLMACQNAGHEHCTMIQYTMLYNDKTTEKSNSNT